MHKLSWRRLNASEHSWRTSSRNVRLFAALGALLIIAVTAWRLHAAYQSSLDNNQVASANLARSLADNTAAKLLAAEVRVIGAVERLEHDGNSAAAVDRLRNVLARRIGITPGIRTLIAYAADGTVLAASTQADEPAAKAVANDLLRFHSASPDRQSHIGQPTQDAVTGLWTLSLSRRFDRPDQTFGGIAVATFELADFYGALNLGPHGAVSLVRDDGMMIVRVPFLAGRIGANIAAGPFFRAYLDKPTSGNAEAVSAFDGQRRHESYNKVAGFPLIVFVASTQNDIVADWEDQAISWTAVSVLSAALLCWLGLRLAKQLGIAHTAEQALRASETRFRSLYTKTPLPLFSLGRNGRIEHVSQAWLDLFAHDRASVVGQLLIGFMTEQSRKQALKTDWPLLIRTGALNEANLQFVTKAGKVLDVIASARVERDAKGRFLRVLGGLTDVTDRRLAEESLRQAQKIEAIGQLTGGVAHDFNNLLAVVMGNLELLRKRLSDDPRALRLLGNALSGAERGAVLTQRMLAFARKQHLMPASVDLTKLVRGMFDLLQHAVGPDIQIITALPLHLPNAHLDANQLELALLNLAVNARDAMPDGGTLTISASEEAIPATLAETSAAARHVRLSVTDTGNGMDSATLSRAMEPFFTTKGIGKGTGLGLSMVHGLAAQSGGRLVLSSKIGRGTTAELWFPIRAALAPDQVPPSNTVTANMPNPSMPSLTPAASPRPLTILVVDDDDLVLTNTAAMLEDLGHTVFQAPSGPDALSTLDRCGPLDLVVTDQAMPGMTGLQLAQTVQATRPGLPILLVSGYADLPPPADKLPRLNKPFTQAALGHAVAAIMATTRPVPTRTLPSPQTYALAPAPPQ